jgi:Rad3-related DNA helicase
VGVAVEEEVNVFETKGRATDYFVAPSYRKHQRETIEEIEEAYEMGYQHVVVDAPTGSGKSHVARAFAFQSNDAHILTIQKLLQDQYQRDFQDMFVMKGRNAYTCLRPDDLYDDDEIFDHLMDDEEVSCAEGPCRLKKRETCDDCPYKRAFYRAQSAPVTVHNFDSFYYQNVFAGGFTGRKLLVVDEAHNIANKFSGFLSFTINSRGGIEVPEGYTISDYDNFVKYALETYQEELRGLAVQYEVDSLSRDDLRRMQDLTKLTKKMRRYLDEREKDYPAEYVFDYTKDGRWAPKVTFRPVYVGDYTGRWLFSYGARSLLMSATILDKEMFCKEVGLTPESVYYVNVPSSFPPENRPIVKKYAGKMGYKDIKGTLPTIVEYVQEIVDRYPDRKGIVQTHSEKIASYLKRFLDDPRFTFNKDYRSPQEMLEVHREKPGSVIVASGLREGLDLYGELSKVQIFCKIPYPNLGDKVVARKLELNEQWYRWITTVMFVQALGRSIRSPKEKAVTYILDSGFGFFYTRSKKYVPKYIKDAIKW